MIGFGIFCFVSARISKDDLLTELLHQANVNEFAYEAGLGLQMLPFVGAFAIASGILLLADANHTEDQVSS